MSTELFAHKGLFVTRFAGPASEGLDRRRWQFTIPRDIEYVQFNAEELSALLNSIVEDVRAPLAAGHDVP